VGSVVQRQVVALGRPRRVVVDLDPNGTLLVDEAHDDDWATRNLVRGRRA
jgi:hypothetical protein